MHVGESKENGKNRAGRSKYITTQENLSKKARLANVVSKGAERKRGEAKVRKKGKG